MKRPKQRISYLVSRVKDQTGDPLLRYCNECSASRTTSNEEMDDREKTWHGLRAASLSILAGAGHLYLGEKQGYLIVGFGAALIIISRLFWRPAELLYLSLAIFSAVDAYSIAKRGRGLM